jgi:hypothetical protein
MASFFAGREIRGNSSDSVRPWKLYHNFNIIFPHKGDFQHETVIEMFDFGIVNETAEADSAESHGDSGTLYDTAEAFWKTIIGSHFL